MSEGWVRLAAGNAKDRFGNAMTVKLKGPVEPYFRAPEALRPSDLRPSKLRPQGREVEAARRHPQGARLVPRPFRLGAVAVQFHPVAVRVVEVERLAHAVVAGSGQRDPGAASRRASASASAARVG